MAVFIPSEQSLKDLIDVLSFSNDQSSSRVIVDGVGRVVDDNDPVGRRQGDLDAASAHQAPGVAVQTWRCPRSQALPVNDNHQG